MGLDMYLFSLPKINELDYGDVTLANAQMSKHQAEKDEIYEKIKPLIKHFEEYDLSWSSLYEEVAYWRKANQIHNWFVEMLHNGEDNPCFTQVVTKENLQDLYNLCRRVLTRTEHPMDLLPTRPGCYFGSTSYDSFYYRQIDETQSLIAALLKNFNFETHYLLYQCSW
jgi:hypothetical protein